MADGTKVCGSPSVLRYILPRDRRMTAEGSVSPAPAGQTRPSTAAVRPDGYGGVSAARALCDGPWHLANDKTVAGILNARPRGEIVRHGSSAGGAMLGDVVTGAEGM